MISIAHYYFKEVVMLDFAALMPAAFTNDPKHLITIVVVALVVTIASFVVNQFTKRR